MMGKHQPQKELFHYAVDLDKRVRADHPLRRINAIIDFDFVRGEVAHTYGYNGNESVDPVQIVKMMLLLFLDNVESERELMRIIAERLDYLWFLGWGLDDAIPDHSVLSKARRRWGPALFEQLFVRVVGQCVTKGLVDGRKIHVDGSLIRANASTHAVVSASPELIAALRDVYQAEERKLEDRGDPSRPHVERVNDHTMNRTDPDSALVNKDGKSLPRYKHHRAVDDAHGVITAVKTTRGDVKENGQLMALVEQHQTNTAVAVETVVGDHQYGTAENLRVCAQEDIRCHLGDFREHQEGLGRRAGIFAEEHFVYDASADTYRCPAGQVLTRRKHKAARRAYEYAAAKAICQSCPLRPRCTRARGTPRSIKRHEGQELIDRARAQSRSEAAVRDRIRRRWRMEGSFADAANQHGFKRARWRRLWRQRIQDYMIATVQNIRILLRHADGPRANTSTEQTASTKESFFKVLTVFASRSDGRRSPLTFLTNWSLN